MLQAYYQSLLAAAAKKAPFTPVAYLESTGTQYINTGVLPDFAGGDEIEIHYYSPSTSGSVCVFGSRQANVRNGFYALGGGGITVADSAGYGSFYISNNDVQLTVNDLAVTANGTAQTMPKRVSCAFPMFLFALNNGGNAFGIYNGCKIYDWIYRRNGAVAQHLVPALDAQGVPCMWDTVANTAKYNAGTGIFNYA